MRQASLLLVTALVAPALLATAAAQAATPTDWRATLLRDAQAIHDTIAANSPGPVDPFQPGFAARNDSAFAHARDRAADVRSAVGYAFALREQVASFNDEHFALKLNVTLAAQWPGFLTGEAADGTQRVMTEGKDAPVPLGAVLRDCDGIEAAGLARRNLAPFAGRWELASQRIRYSGELLLDRGNPFIARPMRCDFDVGGKTLSVTLAWRALSSDEVTTRLGDTAPRAHPPIGSLRLPDGTLWFNFSTFGGDPDTPKGRALVALLAQMKRDRDSLRSAPSIVLDLRGNNGGSSDWGSQAGTIIWGEAASEAYQQHGAATVAWRASPDNLAVLQHYEKAYANAPGVSPEAKRWATRAVIGMRDADRMHQPLWRAPDDPEVSRPGAPEPPPKGLVYVLTDFMCTSACLDALEEWQWLGAVQIGQQTSADTYDMDDREDPLPSGHATFWQPMKVYRNRTRGWNVPFTPIYLYDGDMRDTAALQRWVASLPR